MGKNPVYLLQCIKIGAMKIKYLFLLLFFKNFSASAQVCSCNIDSSLTDIINCKEIIFNNKAKLYRQFSCDSSWYIFENKKQGIKKSIYSLEAGLIDLTERLGYQYACEFRKTFLIQNNLISGCCTPPEYILFNKTSGNQYKNLGRLIYYNKDYHEGIVVYFKDSSCNSIIVYFVDSGKKIITQVPKGRFIYTLKKDNSIYPEYLFEETNLKGDVLILEYRYQINEETDKWHIQKIRIKLKD